MSICNGLCSHIHFNNTIFLERQSNKKIYVICNILRESLINMLCSYSLFLSIIFSYYTLLFCFVFIFLCSFLMWLF
uniref:Uncharacterized protein n=1 Tax=Poecilia latipinna TaxID=48699 RepID=A0A3B3V8K9_9TELE